MFAVPHRVLGTTAASLGRWRAPARWAAIGAVLAALFATGVATAQQPPGSDDTLEQVEQFAARARSAYQGGRYEEAIGYYLRAYRLEPAGALLYNIAYIFDRKLGEAESAMDYYRRYVRASDAEPDVVERALARIAEIKEQGRSTPRPIDEPDPTPDPDPSNTIVRPQPSPPMSGHELAGWVTLSVGVAGIVGATTMSIVAQQTSSDFDTETQLSSLPGLRDRGESQALTADILWGVGGAAVVTGVVLLLTKPAPSAGGSASADVRVGASFDSHGGMLLIGGSM